MSVRRELLRIVEDAHSVAPIPHAATRVIADRLDGDRCAAFVTDPQGALVRYEAGTADRAPSADEDDEDMRSVAAEALATRRGVARASGVAALLASPWLLRGRSSGAATAGDRRIPALPDARSIVAALAHLWAA